MLRKIVITVVLYTFVSGALGGCNTVQGLGKDIEKAGEKTQEAAEAVKKKL